jgi:drug/metabolite transporter (DMT)-like permease
MTTSYLAALGAALCWSVGGLIALGPVRALGSLSFNRLRMVVVFAILVAVSAALGGWRSLLPEHLVGLALSGAVGILIGDTLLFQGLRMLGPSRNAVVYATAAPITALLGWLLLGEGLGPLGVAGIALCTGGVMMAVVFARRPDAGAHEMERVHGSLLVGVGFAFGAACCQAVGTILAKPVMAAGVDPVAASAVRVGVAGAGLLLTGFLPGRRAGLLTGVTPRLLGLVALNGVLGMGVGMTLVLAALVQGNPGIVSTLSSTTPVMILPLLWAHTGRAPSPGAWFGAAVTVAGIALIFGR